MNIPKPLILPLFLGISLFFSSCTLRDREDPGDSTSMELRVGTTTRGADDVDMQDWRTWWDFHEASFLMSRPSGGFVSASGGNQSPVSGSILDSLKGLMMDDENSFEIRAAAMEALAALGAEPANLTSLFRNYLESEKGRLSHPAVVSLTAISSQEASDDLLHILKNDREGRQLFGSRRSISEFNRAYAAYGLALAARATADNDFKNLVAATLWEILADTRSSKQDLSVACVLGLGILRQADPYNTLDHLLAYTSEGDSLACAHGPTAIAQIAIGGRVNSTTFESVQNYFINLVEHRVRGRFAKLIRYGAVQALGSTAGLGSKETQNRAVDVLTTQSYKAQDRHERDLATMALANWALFIEDDTRTKIVEHIVKKRLQKGDNDARSWAALSLGRLAWNLRQNKQTVPQEIEDSLYKAMERARSGNLRSVYSLALGLAGSTQSGEMVQEWFVDANDNNERSYAALSLGMLGRKEAIPSLSGVFTERLESPALLARSAQALMMLQDIHTPANLIDLLAGNQNRRLSTNEQLNLITALGRVASSAPASVLAGLAVDENQPREVRVAAASATGCSARANPATWATPVIHAMNPLAGVNSLTDPDLGLAFRGGFPLYGTSLMATYQSQVRQGR
ncbi:MAG: hypothetical protein CMJ96_00150 [Planctomycetes bacterium]|nr:hypothetical protein [Planctomycetota bacterium]